MRWLVAACVVAVGLGYCAVQAFDVKPTTVGDVRVIDDRTLGVSVEYGGCERVAGVTVKETATAVRLLAHHRVTSIPFSGCPAVARVREVPVELERPLAGRAVVDVECEHRGRTDCTIAPRLPS